jgi:two-component system, OmpR family, sensor histidine kinase MtrB
MSLRLKVALLITSVAAIATLACALVFASLQFSDLKEAEKERRRLLVDGVSRIIEEAHLAKDPLMLIDYVSGLRNRQDVRYCRVMINGAWKDAGPRPAEDPVGVIKEVAHGKGIKDTAVELEFSRSAIEARLANSWSALAANTARAGMIVFLFGLLLSFPLSWTVTRRIMRIERALTEIGAGTAAEPLPSLGADEIGRLAEGVNAMAERLRELDRLKKAFVASVTHELRSPLGVIEGYVKQLLSGSSPLTAEDRANLERIESNARRLGHFVTNLLDMAKIERGTLDFSPKQADAAEIVQDAVEFFSGKAKESGIVLDCQIEPGLPAVRLDPDLITHVLTNLLSNALKFTRRGGRVSVFLRRQGPAVEVSVCDTGVGIKKEDVGRIFAPFQRVANPLRATGVGLGLAISKQIAAMHQGSIGVTSEIGKGSRFFITLPLQAQ